VIHVVSSWFRNTPLTVAFFVPVVSRHVFACFDAALAQGINLWYLKLILHLRSDDTGGHEQQKDKEQSRPCAANPILARSCVWVVPCKVLCERDCRWNREAWWMQTK
jgi:hypothetical protein